MQVVVLAGGRGERLDPLTLHRPKPLLPVLGRPLLGRLLDHLAAQDVVDELLITAGYLGSQIAGYVETLRLSVPVRVVQEGEARGTAGSVVDLAGRLRSPFAVVSGDALLSIDLGAMLAAHRSLRAALTICAVPPDERLRFGIVHAARGPDGAGLATAFDEKPALGELVSDAVVNTGCYVMESRVLAELPRRGLVDFGRDVFPRLMASGGRVAALAAAKGWCDIGTLESYRDAHLRAVGRADADLGPVGMPVAALGCGAVVEGPVYLGPGCTVGAAAHLVGPLHVGAGCFIGAHACVERSVLLDGCLVEAGSWVRDAVVDAGAAVPGGCAIRAAIVGCLPGLATPTSPLHPGRGARAAVLPLPPGAA